LQNPLKKIEKKLMKGSNQLNFMLILIEKESFAAHYKWKTKGFFGRKNFAIIWIY